ncbi:kinase-like domain-containing protein, partial [Chytriomyces sp. MP71]
MAQQLLAHNSAQSLLNQRIVFADSLSVSLTRFIQSGSYAHVFEALNEATGDVLAVKCIVKQGLSPSSIEKQRFEAHVLTSLAASNTPHVISVLAHSETRDYIFLLMTRYQDDLLDLINDGSICASTSDVFVQICLAIEACHALGVFHQDIKPENILINTHRGRIQACLSDFGLATTTAHPDTFGCGSISYTSPESLAGQDSGSTAESYSARAQDAWSLAVLLFILITGYTPW